MKKNIVLLGICMCLLGCYDEDIKLSSQGEPFYTLPQGDHPYDKCIVEWFEKYGFYTLYDFDERDLYWNNTDWEESEMLDYGLTGKLLGYKADTNYVAEQVQLFQDLFLAHYPDEYLEKGMPLKILLCSYLKLGKNQRIWNPEIGKTEVVTVYDDLWGKKGYDYLAINGGNELVKNMTDSLKAEFYMGVNSLFLRILGEKKLLVNPPSVFFEFSNDYYGEYFPGDAAMFQIGILTQDVRKNTVEESMHQDFLAYLALAGYPLSILEGNVGVSDNAYMYPSLRGVFRSDRDVNGIVRQKYDIIVEWLRTLGIEVDALQNP